MRKRGIFLALPFLLSSALAGCSSGHRHSMEWVNEILPTCTDYGVAGHYECTGCDALFDAEKNEISGDELIVSPLGHSWNYQDADDETHSGTCSRCGTTQTEKHVYGNPVVTKDATCTEKGTETFTCTLCGHSRETETDTIPHVFTRKILTDEYLKSAATCTEPAVYFYACSECGARGDLTFESGEPLGHEMTYHEGKAATCTESGTVSYYHCSRCGNDFADIDGTADVGETEIPASGHHFQEDTGICSGCGMSLDDIDSAIAALPDGTKAYHGTAIQDVYELYLTLSSTLQDRLGNKELLLSLKEKYESQFAVLADVTSLQAAPGYYEETYGSTEDKDSVYGRNMTFSSIQVSAISGSWFNLFYANDDDIGEIDNAVFYVKSSKANTLYTESYGGGNAVMTPLNAGEWKEITISPETFQYDRISGIMMGFLSVGSSDTDTIIQVSPLYSFRLDVSSMIRSIEELPDTESLHFSDISMVMNLYESYLKFPEAGRSKVSNSSKLLTAYEKVRHVTSFADCSVLTNDTGFNSFSVTSSSYGEDSIYGNYKEVVTNGNTYWPIYRYFLNKEVASGTILVFYVYNPSSASYDFAGDFSRSKIGGSESCHVTFAPQSWSRVVIPTDGTSDILFNFLLGCVNKVSADFASGWRFSDVFTAETLDQITALE